MVSEMVPDEKMGWFHNHGLKQFEDWLELPLKFVCRILCCENPFNPKKWKRRGKEQEQVLHNNPSAILMMTILVIFHLCTELFQRLLDIPY